MTDPLLTLAALQRALRASQDACRALDQAEESGNPTEWGDARERWQEADAAVDRLLDALRAGPDVLDPVPAALETLREWVQGQNTKLRNSNLPMITVDIQLSGSSTEIDVYDWGSDDGETFDTIAEAEAAVARYCAEAWRKGE